MLISFDIGIKNLSYCIFDSTNNTHINDWSIVNLTEEEEINNTHCSFCKKNATFSLNKNEFYCNTHVKKSPHNPVPDIYYKFFKNKKASKKTIQNFCNELKIKLPTDLEYIHENICNYIENNYLLKVSKNKKIANEIDLITIGCNLANKLSSLLPLDKITCVIIENQISPIATRMKTLQGMLAQFFIDREIKNIKFISSINKLKKFNLKKLSYSERKKASITITKDILSKSNDFMKWLPVFEKHKKKDDLADCFLQGFWFLENSE